MWSPDLWRWLGNAKPKSLPKKRIKIKLLLAEIFHGQPVPDEYSRNELRADLLKRDKSLNPLHFDTLKSAIDEYNAERT